MFPRKAVVLILFATAVAAAVALGARRSAAGGPSRPHHEPAAHKIEKRTRQKTAKALPAAIAVVLFGLIALGSYTGGSSRDSEFAVTNVSASEEEFDSTFPSLSRAPARSGWTELQSGSLASLPVVAAASASTLRTFYVDASSGSDSNPGTSAARAWRTVERASSATLLPGDRLLLRRGQTFAGSLSIAESGTAAAAIYVTAYGSGAKPVITGASSCVKISGSYVVVNGLHMDDCSWAGFEMAAGSRFNTAVGSVMTRSIVGVHLQNGSSNNRIIANRVSNNTKMSKLTPEPNDDSGAFGILLNGDLSEIANNTITGHDTFSYDYGRDGAAVEIFGGQSNHIHHNLAIDNHTFSELGNPRASGNMFGYNVVRSSLATSTFLVTRGAQDGRGPVIGTRLYNNTVVLTGSQSEGFVCHGGCAFDTLQLRNNIITAVMKAGYADGPIDEDYNLFHGGQTQFSVGPHSVIGDPAFVSAPSGTFELRPSSRAIDAGAFSPYASDFAGRATPQDGNGDRRPATDLGAYEYSPNSGTPAPTQPASPTRTATPGAISTPSRTATATPRLTTTPAPTATPAPVPTSSTPGSGSVTPSRETDSVPNGGDAADDPAIWINPTNPALSTIIGTNKLGGLAVYDLTGKQLHYYGGIRPNNVDVRYGFNAGGIQGDIVTASEVGSDTILIYRVDPLTRGLVNLRAQARDTGFGVAGLCMFKSPASGKFFVFVSDSSGNVKQFELTASGGLIDYTLVRSLSFGTVTEGCVADDQRQALYISQEDVALWRLSAEPNGGSAKTQVATVNGTLLTADLEGLAIYDKGNGAGYLIASSQGSDDFAVFDRQTNIYRGRFRVAAGGIDTVTHTDGIDVVSTNLGPLYPGGLFVAQDDRNDTGNQNFKLVSWTSIAQAVPLP